MTYPTKKLWEICNIKTWRKDANYWTDNWIYPFFTCSSKILKAPWYSFDTDAILIAWNWDVWACKEYNWKFEAYQRTYVLDNFIWIEKKLLFYYLDWYLRKILVSETLWSIPLPPIPTQKLIVQKLDSAFKNIDESIKITKNNIENIEELNKSVLDGVFIDWEKKYWLEKLVNITDLITDGSHFSPKITEKGFPYITVKDLDWEWNIDTKYCKKISENDFKILEKGNCSPIDWDILFSKDWTVWKTAIVKDIKIVVLSSLAIIRWKKYIFPKFLYYMFISDIFLKKALWKKTWAAIKRIVLRTIKGLKIPLPPLSKQKEIVAYLDEVFEKNKVIKEWYEKKLKELEEMKQSILKEAFEGRLVKD